MTVLQFRGPMAFRVLQWCHPMLASSSRTSCCTQMITLYGTKVDSGPRIENVGKKSGGKGGKPKSSSKKGDDEGGKEGVGLTRVMRAMQKKLDEEEEERNKQKRQIKRIRRRRRRIERLRIMRKKLGKRKERRMNQWRKNRS